MLWLGRVDSRKQHNRNATTTSINASEVSAVCLAIVLRPVAYCNRDPALIDLFPVAVVRGDGVPVWTILDLRVRL